MKQSPSLISSTNFVMRTTARTLLTEKVTQAASPSIMNQSSRGKQPSNLL